jgi:hypothetical protein
MGRTPDRRQGRLEEEAILFEDQATDPTEIGVLQRNGTGLLYKKDGGAAIDLLAAPAGDTKEVKVSSDDTTPGFLETKIVPSGDGSITITVLNPAGNETLELKANVATIFSADAINASIQLTTSLTTPQNAFAGETPDFVAPTTDGDYLCFLAADLRTTNNNTTAEIALGLNSVGGTIVGSEHQFTNTQRGFSGAVFRVDGLVTTDKIYGSFRKVAGNGSVEIYSRNLYMFRVA